MRRDRRELSHEGQADNPNSLAALHLQAATVKPIAGGAAAGALAAALIIVAGATAAAGIAIVVSVLVIVVGAVDYVGNR